MYQLLYSIGYILGPSSSLLVINVDFRLSTWYIDQGNAVGLLLGMFSFILLVCVFFFVSDISKEYDMIFQKQQVCESNIHGFLKLANITDELGDKSYSEKEKYSKNQCSVRKNRDKTMKLWSFKDLLRFDILIVSFVYELVV